jgi:hypothetical protein
MTCTERTGSNPMGRNQHERSDKEERYDEAINATMGRREKKACQERKMAQQSAQGSSSFLYFIPCASTLWSCLFPTVALCD